MISLCYEVFRTLPQAVDARAVSFHYSSAQSNTRIRRYMPWLSLMGHLISITIMQFRYNGWRSIRHNFALSRRRDTAYSLSAIWRWWQWIVSHWLLGYNIEDDAEDWWSSRAFSETEMKYHTCRQKHDISGFIYEYVYHYPMSLILYFQRDITQRRRSKAELHCLPRRRNTPPNIQVGVAYIFLRFSFTKKP